MFQDQDEGDRFQVVFLAAGGDGDRNLGVLRGGQDELHVRRRLLQGLEQRVEGRVGEHVDLIDDVDLEAVPGRRVAGALAKLANVVHAGIGGGVDFQDVQAVGGGDLGAGDALGARLVGRSLLTVQGFGQNPGRGGLSHSPHARKEEGMGDASAPEGVPERPRDRLLSCDLVEGLRTPFPCQNHVAHE